MNKIIPLSTTSFGDEPVQTVNARDLHFFLEVKTPFKDWIRRRIEDFGFVENVDFVKITAKSNGSNLSETYGGRPVTEYFLSLSMAKELAMVERTPKGKEARLYFIECERRAKEASSFKLPDFEDPAAAALAWAEQYRARRALEVKVEEDAPKVAFTDGVIATGAETTITGAAKILGIRPKAFFDWLRNSGYVYKQTAQATSKSIEAGLMVVRFVAILHTEDDIEKKAYAHVTGKGLYVFYRKLLEAGLIAHNAQLDLAAA